MDSTAANEVDDPTQEQLVWSGSPSQWTNVWPIVIGVLFAWLIVPAVWAAWCILVVRCTRYEISTQRLRMLSGVFSKRTDEVELYRVRDTTLLQSFIQRLVGVGSIVVISSDATEAEAVLRSVREPIRVREFLRASVERRRRTTRSRTLEFD